MSQPPLEFWSHEEDRLLVALLKVHGTRWSLIARDIPMRSVSSIRNRWLRMNAKEKGNNICRKCGKRKRGHTCSSVSRDVLRASSDDDVRNERDESMLAPGSPPLTPPLSDHVLWNNDVVQDAGMEAVLGIALCPEFDVDFLEWLRT